MMTGAELKAWRNHVNDSGHRMLQQDLADKLEQHRRTIQSWERKKATLTGHDAIEYAAAHNLLLNKYTDPTEKAREGLTVEEAREIAREDDGLIWRKAGPGTAKVPLLVRLALGALVAGIEPLGGWEDE